MARNFNQLLHPEILQKVKNLRSFVVLDVETTGFDCSKNRIIEIGLIKVADGKIIDEFTSFVNPGSPVPAHISALTGITDDKIADAPVFDEIAKHIAAFMGDSIIVGHNIPFDIGFMICEFARCGMRRDYEYVDTLFLSRKVFPELKSHKLSNIITHIGIDASQNHRALDDARLTLILLMNIQKQCGTPSLDEIINCSQSAENKRKRSDPLSDGKVHYR